MRRLIYIALIAISVVAMAQQKPSRVPAYPGVIERVQPNGDTVYVRLHGDEHKHWMTTLDGKLVIENKKGYICYAREKKNGKIVATCKKVKSENGKASA